MYLMDAQQAWQAVLGQLQMEMSKASFDTWVRHAELVSYELDTFTIGVQNAYARDWLEDRLSSTICRMLNGLMNNPQQVKFVVWQRVYDLGDAVLEEEDLDQNISSALPSCINSRYTFDSFIVGSNNRLAHAACMAVADMAVTYPARSYNPLFLYGGVGLGKTHLLHAIGNAAHKRGLQVLYVSSEEFTNDLIKSIQSRSTTAFRDRYRLTDVLLVDDIQFFIGKESTLEEFFHTFNTLHGQNKQIVISSDRPPKAMATLEDRLRSRFEWGLTVDVQPPDLETRVAILRCKAAQSCRDVGDSILQSIARQVQSNIRELEGALTRVLAFADLSGKELNDELVDIALADLLPNRETVEPQQLMKTVANCFGLSIERMLGRDRSREVALPRQVAMYLMREDGNVSLPQIGEAIGGRDHTTVMYACDKVADLMERDETLRRKIVKIREQLYGQARLAA
jgi:chromosomal replication initiator protein